MEDIKCIILIVKLRYVYKSLYSRYKWRKWLVALCILCNILGVCCIQNKLGQKNFFVKRMTTEYSHFKYYLKYSFGILEINE